MTDNNNRLTEDNVLEKPMSRRDMLRLTGAGGAGLLLGAAGVSGLMGAFGGKAAKPAAASADASTIIDFYGEHQAGIVTPAPDFLLFAAFDLTVTDKEDVRKLFQAWTTAAAALAKGQMLGESNDNENLPPSDTGEAAGLSPSRTTITFGVGASFFDSRFGFASKRPEALVDLPAFGGDELQEEWTGGDIGVQVNADDMQVAFHALRSLARIARGKAVLRWTQEGFQRTAKADPAGSTPRNLMGFKDGTANPDVKDSVKMNKILWAQAEDGAPWMAGGTYMVARRIRIRVEVWDRSTLGDQEATFGRHRDSGAPLGSKNEFDKVDLAKLGEDGKPLIPVNSHVALARGDGSIEILRRGYSYSSGMDKRTGQLDAGLMFVGFNRDPRKQFIPMQTKLGKSDTLNEYIVHTGSAMFACFPGVKQGGYIGETLFQA
ncbi:iron uptake transporter deferrochelatase/peroxidase subunit [Paenibacillus sp. NEAU-GSW1]|uniref:iron uptake transporter deferrochelatase/peroxidase subunit n=1 Tax=Paenibacillus sp. NEAU-GSW1 TaxID=2682486 RepID=UPI0012E0F4ED|nr:iron uptake transporter deferrochelatase/peroxidase subunit [Paenibacillus sp. NEAU-GSW1]MUT68438.1 deferrochelatase/peroxidase EfeB [Paenibacillus sp. NEAU-GSW1]